MKRYWWVIAIVGVVLLNVAAHFCVLRLDLTDDQRYSLSTATKKLLNELDAPVEVTVYLAGDLNPSFQRLKNATAEMVEEMGKLRPSKSPLKGDFANPSSEDLSALGLTPIVIHERAHNGTTVQQTVYPYEIGRAHV